MMNKNTKYDIVNDTIGTVQIPKDVAWGPCTQRSVDNFLFPEKFKVSVKLVKTMIAIKYACAKTNKKYGKLPENIADAIMKACEILYDNTNMDYFPITIFQTGSGTQTNMNVNEVIAKYANKIILNEQPGFYNPVHPNDHVNMCQSTNDVFPSTNYIVIFTELKKKLIPTLQKFYETLVDKQTAFMNVIKIGRTHLMDAVPMTLGDEFSGFTASIEYCKSQMMSISSTIEIVVLGGTAVGTGLNTYPEFSEDVVKNLNAFLRTDFKLAKNRFEIISTITRLVNLAGILTALSTTLIKIANDIRLLGSGPRAGLSELELPATEAGSSIMPGKVNPTQCESVIMVGTYVNGLLSTLTACNVQPTLQLNLFQPLISLTLLDSIDLLNATIQNFSSRCLSHLLPCYRKINENVQNSLLAATILNPILGYQKVAKVVEHMIKNNFTLKQSVLELKMLTEQQFDKAFDISKIAKPF